METGKKQAGKSFAILLLILLLSLASISYGDAVAPGPNPLTWRVIPTTLGPTEIGMAATPGRDAGGDYPINYNFVCTNDAGKTSGWRADANYIATGLTPGTVYSFKADACDSAGNVTGFTYTRSATTDAVTTPPVLRLDMNYDTNNDDANTYVGFTKFNRASSGSEVNGVIIDLSGNLYSTRRADPCGAWEPYYGSYVNDPCYYSPFAGERIYRDFIYGIQPSGVTITLWGLGTNRDCNIGLWAWDSKSTGESNRVAKWYANGIYIFDTNFLGGAPGSAYYPRYDNQTTYSSADLYKWAVKKRVTTDEWGRIILTSSRGPSSSQAEPFAFVNAIKVEPNKDIAFHQPKYAHRPVPFSDTEDVPVYTDLKWRNGEDVVTHDLYLGEEDEDAPYPYDAFSVVMNQSGVITSGTGSDPCFPNWYYYPLSNWWNVWFYNAPYDDERWKEIWIDLTVEPNDIAQPANVMIITGGSTGAWAATPNGSVRPPLPGDVDAVTEPLYINRIMEPNYKNTNLTGPQDVHLHIIIDEYNPEWAFVDVRGVNFRIVGGSIKHVCHGPVLLHASDAANPYDPYGANGFLKLDKTYYWRVDENPGPYKGEGWSFTTCPNSIVDNYNPYADTTALRKVWKDGSTNGSRALVFAAGSSTDPNRGGPPHQSMRYEYKTNYQSPYYAKAEASITTLLPNGLGEDPNWLGMGAKSLSLWFYGKAGNDANKPMYVLLTDGSSPTPNSAKIRYNGDMNDIKVPVWHEWNIVLQEFVDANSPKVNLANVSKIAITIGDGTPAANDGIDDWLWFEDVQVYTTRCALIERDTDFAKLDYAPLATFGDCVIDYEEIDAIADNWLNRDAVVKTKNPGDTNLVVYYPMNEADGNLIYSHPDTSHLDVCDANWTGTFWNSGTTPPGYHGTTFSAPDYNGSGSCVYLDGSQGARIQCGKTYGNLRLGIGHLPGDINAITVSAWVKSLGSRTWDSYLMAKFMGILGKRGGWDEQSVIWMFSVTPSAQAFCFTSYQGGLYSASVLPPFWGQWAHLAATYPHLAANPADANSHARIYLNGGQVNSGLFIFSHGYDANIFLSVGETQDQNAWVDCPESFYGYIDEVHIYNRVLEANEIAYLADTTPEDGELWIPIPSPANVYDANEIPPYVGEQPKGQRVVNFKDFAMVVKRWLEEEMYPR